MKIVECILGIILLAGFSSIFISDCSGWERTPRRVSGQTELSNFSMQISGYYLSAGKMIAFEEYLDENSSGNIFVSYAIEDKDIRSICSPEFIEESFVEGRSRFAYYPGEEGKFIVWSRGPDGDYDVDVNMLKNIVNKSNNEIARILSNSLYDPTNGATSNGDIVLF